MSRHSKRNGRSRERFVMLPHVVLRSAGYRSLSPPARCVLIELLAIYDGKNNGRLAFSARQGAEALNCSSKATVARALIELQETGFLELVKAGSFSLKGRLASEYRVTLHRCDVTGKLPSNSFMRSPEKVFHGLTTDHHGISGETVGAETHTKRASTVSLVRPWRPKKASDGLMGETHIVYHLGARSRPPASGLKWSTPQIWGENTSSALICDDPEADGPVSCALHGWRGRT